MVLPLMGRYSIGIEPISCWLCSGFGTASTTTSWRSPHMLPGIAQKPMEKLETHHLEIWTGSIQTQRGMFHYRKSVRFLHVSGTVTAGSQAAAFQCSYKVTHEYLDKACQNIRADASQEAGRAVEETKRKYISA